MARAFDKSKLASHAFEGGQKFEWTNAYIV
jgi:hypothetical protein